MFGVLRTVEILVRSDEAYGKDGGGVVDSSSSGSSLRMGNRIVSWGVLYLSFPSTNQNFCLQFSCIFSSAVNCRWMMRILC